MTEACKTHYSQLHQMSKEILETTFASAHAESIAKSHAYIADLSLWAEVLASRPELPALKSAVREYQYSLLALTLGHYRAAFSALRLSLELVFATVQWSANEREFREWLSGQRDSNWASLTDNENGILSKQFVRLFAPDLMDECVQYRASAVAVYRECSEYVHGNAHTHRSLPDRLIYDAVTMNTWLKKASSVRLTTSFALAVRYLADLATPARAQLEPILLDHLGHSPGIRAMLSNISGDRT